MKRRLLLVTVFLLTGAVVNVAGAWGCCLLWKLPWPVLFAPSKAATAYWTGQTPVHFDKPAIPRLVGSNESLGMRRRIGWTEKASTGNDEEGITEPPGAFFIAGIIEAGWPLRGLNGQWWIGGSSDDPDLLMVYGVALPGSDFVSRPGVLPLRPIWPGFAVNTIFYAVFLWLLSYSALVLRRFIRVKRGHCTACAYPIGESDVCSECGKALPGRAKVPT